jgi:hypothetical protein
MARLSALIVAIVLLFTLKAAPAPAASTFGTIPTGTISPDNTLGLYAFTRAGAQISGFSDPTPIPGLKITLPPGSQNGPKFAMITLNLSTLQMSCYCSAVGAIYLAIGRNRFASGEVSVYYSSSYTSTPATIVAAIPLTFSQQVVVGEWGLAASGSSLNLGPWASLSAILLANLTTST